MVVWLKFSVSAKTAILHFCEDFVKYGIYRVVSLIPFGPRVQPASFNRVVSLKSVGESLVCDHLSKSY